jgi:hypothetical protein
MDEATLLPFDLPALARKKLTVDFDGGYQSFDAGLLCCARPNRRSASSRGWPPHCPTG